MNRLARALVVASVLAAFSFQVAAQQRAGFGRRLGDALTGTNRQDAYLEGLQRRQELELRRAEMDALQAAEELRRAEESNRRSDAAIRSKLAEYWTMAGYAPDEARSIASAFQWTETQEAIIANVRTKGIISASEDARAALDRYDYLLANQLLVAMIAVSIEINETP